MAVRKSVTALTPQEKADFVRGLKLLKDSGVYDSYVDLHSNNLGGAHNGPAFLPWHREFILRFELDLQSALGNTDLGLPYWDWATDAVLADPTDPLQAVVWRNDLMGGDGQPVNRGPFRAGEWAAPGGNLIRQFGNPSRMATQDEVNATLGVTPYDQPPFHENQAGAVSFRKQLEGFIGTSSGLHNGMHVWVGGSDAQGNPLGQMSNVRISPSDPVFWLHHCNVDRIWALWEACRPDTVAPYLPDGGARPGHNLTEPMVPFNLRERAHVRRPQDVAPQDVLDIGNLRDTAGTDIGYSYDTFHRRFVTLRRTSGNRFVSDQQIEITAECGTQDDSGTTIFLPAASGGTVQAKFVRVQPGPSTGDVVEAEILTDEINVS